MQCLIILFLIHHTGKRSLILRHIYVKSVRELSQALKHPMHFALKELAPKKALFPNIYMLMVYAVLMPMTNAFCERMFSLRTATKTERRNRLSTLSLNQCLFMSVNGPSGDINQREVRTIILNGACTVCGKMISTISSTKASTSTWRICARTLIPAGSRPVRWARMCLAYTMTCNKPKGVITRVLELLSLQNPYEKLLFHE